MKGYSLLFTFILIGCQKLPACSAGLTAFIDNLLLKYDKAEPPPDGPTVVKIGLFVNKLAVSFHKRRIELLVYMRYNWNDTRLKYTPKPGQVNFNMGPDRYQQIWLPDIFIRNSDFVENRDIMNAGVLMYINPHGNVWYVRRFNIGLFCAELKRSSRTMHCQIMFESYSNKADTILIKPLERALDLDTSGLRSRYEIQGPKIQDCSQNYTAGTFPCLSMELTFTGGFSYLTGQARIVYANIFLAMWYGGSFRLSAF